MTCENIIASIEPLDEAAMAKARERQAQLAKPPPEAWVGWKICPFSWQALQDRYITKLKRSICWYLLLTTAWWRKVFPLHRNLLL